jgi:hypothetical protein
MQEKNRQKNCTKPAEKIAQIAQTGRKIKNRYLNNCPHINQLAPRT